MCRHHWKLYELLEHDLFVEQGSQTNDGGIWQRLLRILLVVMAMTYK